MCRSGPVPVCPQDEALQCAGKNLLCVRKACVSRMHSLPNDSYMFRPVRPASAPFPLSEVESCDGSLHLGTAQPMLLLGGPVHVSHDLSL